MLYSFSELTHEVEVHTRPPEETNASVVVIVIAHERQFWLIHS